MAPLAHIAAKVNAPVPVGASPSLFLYDAACSAIARAISVDEVQEIRDRSEALRAYAAQAKNRKMEIDCAEIRIRAEWKLGQLLSMEYGNKPKSKVLVRYGLNRQLAWRAIRMAAMEPMAFDKLLSDWRDRAVTDTGRRVPVTLHEFRNDWRQRRVLNGADTLAAFKLADGTSIGAVRFGRLQALIRKLEMEVFILNRIALHSTAQDDACVRDIINNKTLDSFILEAKRKAKFVSMRERQRRARSKIKAQNHDNRTGGAPSAVPRDPNK